MTCCLFYTLACLAWTIWAGPDQSWDLLNYHLYVAHAWWQNRLPEELFAASAQGYLNPLAHLPYYALFASGWHNLAIAAGIAILHSTNLWLLHAIAAQVITASDRLSRYMLVSGVILGGLTPAFLLETGTSFTDVVVSIPSLGSLYFLTLWLRQARSAQHTAWGRLWLAAGLAGIAMGLKPSALVFSAATALAATLLSGPRFYWASAWRMFAGGFGGLMLSGGPHAFMLWSAFANPVFPLFNGIFHSPWFVDANVVAERFRPASFVDALSYPLYLANPFYRIGFERIAADIRPLFLIVLALMSGLLLAIRRRPQPSGEDRNPGPGFIGLVLLVFLPAWLYTSGNTRYALQGLLLIGPFVSYLALRLPGKTAIVPMLTVSLPLFAQATAAFNLNAVRWEARARTAPGIDIRIPDRLLKEPAYYLSLQTQTFAAVSAFLPAASRFTNVVGQNTLDPDGPVWQEVRKDRMNRGLPWRSLAAQTVLLKPAAISLSNLDDQDALLSEYGLRVRRTDCTWMDLDGRDGPPLRWEQPGDASRGSIQTMRTVLVSCLLEEAPPLPDAVMELRRSADRRMAAWEARCPAQFAPAGAQSQQYSRYRQRTYVNTDSLLLEVNGRLLATFISSGENLVLEDAQGHSGIRGCPQPDTSSINPSRQPAPQKNSSHDGQEN